MKALVFLLLFVVSSAYSVNPDPECAANPRASVTNSSTTRGICDGYKGTYIGVDLVIAVCWKDTSNLCLKYTSPMPGTCSNAERMEYSGDLICSTDCNLITAMKEGDVWNTTTQSCECPSGTTTVTYLPAPTTGPTQYCGVAEEPPPPPETCDPAIKVSLYYNASAMPTCNNLCRITPVGVHVSIEGMTLGSLGPFQQTGDSCEAGTGGPSSPCEGCSTDAPACPSGFPPTNVYNYSTASMDSVCTATGGCPAGYTSGTVGGQPACVGAVGGSTTEETTTTSDTTSTTNPDGTTTETTTTTTTTNTTATGGTGGAGGSGSTSTTTTTTITYNPDGSVASSSTTSTATEEQPVTNSASGGQSCSAPPVCAGDPIQCQQLQQAWLSRCESSTAAFHQSDKVTDTLTFSSSLDTFQASIDQAPINAAIDSFFQVNLSGSACPQWSATVAPFGTIVFDHLCSDVMNWGLVSGVLMIVSLLIAGRIALT